MTLGKNMALAGLLLASASIIFLFHVNVARADKPTAVPFTFTTVDVPGAGSTMVVGINNMGDIVGSYNQIPQAAQLNVPPAFLGTGFVWYKHGKFVSVPGPGPNANAQSCNPLQGGFANCYYMEVQGINDRGDIVGSYSQDILNADGGLFVGFFQQRDGPFTSYLAAGHANSNFQKIKNSGIIYGCFHDEGVDNSPRTSMHGIIYRLTHDGKIENLFSSPEASSMTMGGGEAAVQYTGVFYDTGESRNRGFIVNGRQRTNFDVPGSNVTQAWDMNAQGDVVGYWGDNTNPIVIDGYPFHGFLRDRTGHFIDIEYPGSIDTHVFGINELGVIVGDYVDKNNNVHGFVAEPGDRHAERLSFGDAPLVNASYSKGAASKSIVATMRIIPADKPLLQPAQTPACHHMGIATK